MKLLILFGSVSSIPLISRVLIWLLVKLRFSCLKNNFVGLSLSKKILARDLMKLPLLCSRMIEIIMFLVALISSMGASVFIRFSSSFFNSSNAVLYSRACSLPLSIKIFFTFALKISHHLLLAKSVLFTSFKISFSAIGKSSELHFHILSRIFPSFWNSKLIFLWYEKGFVSIVQSI